MANHLLHEFQRLAGIGQRESTETDYYTPPAPPQRQRQVEQQEEPVQQRPRRKGIPGIRQEMEEMRQEMRARFDRVEERIDGVITETREVREQQTGMSKLIHEMRGEIRPVVSIREQVVYRDRPSPSRPVSTRTFTPVPPREPTPERKEEVIPRYGLLEID